MAVRYPNIGFISAGAFFIKFLPKPSIVRGINRSITSIKIQKNIWEFLSGGGMGRVASLRAVEPPFGSRPFRAPSSGAGGVSGLPLLMMPPGISEKSQPIRNPPYGLLPLGQVGGWPPTTYDAPWDFGEIPAHSESALRAAPLRERVPRAAVPPYKHGNGCLWHPGASYGKIK